MSTATATQTQTPATAAESTTPTPAVTARPLPRVAPPIDVYQLDGAYVLLADVPGLRAEDLEVTCERQVLKLRGNARRSQGTGTLIHQEFGDVCYERTVTFAEPINGEAIKATLAQGVLRIVVPGQPAAQPRRIPVAGAGA